MKKKKKVNAAILIIGNEILSGRTQDKNISFISNWLNLKCGIAVSEVRIIPDVEKIIVKNIAKYKMLYEFFELIINDFTKSFNKELYDVDDIMNKIKNALFSIDSI